MNTFLGDMDRSLNVTNIETQSIPWVFDINIEDSNWIITSSFMIFTMQTGILNFNL